jgi:hypothetical protein
MASSGTYDFSVSNGEVVLAAFERLKVFAPSIRNEHMQTARRELNFLLAEAANKQVNLWKVDLVHDVPLTNGVGTYAVDPKTVMILDAWITVNASGPVPNDLYITPMSRSEYASINNKDTPGRPTTYWFDRLISPEINLWPVPNGSGFTLSYYRCTQMQDANLAGGETPDIPYLWIDWFVAGLAHRLSRSYSTIELEKLRKADAVEAWTVAASQNVENVGLALRPTISSYYRR